MRQSLVKVAILLLMLMTADCLSAFFVVKYVGKHRRCICVERWEIYKFVIVIK